MDDVYGGNGKQHGECSYCWIDVTPPPAVTSQFPGRRRDDVKQPR
jgi:hypothetical protein